MRSLVVGLWVLGKVAWFKKYNIVFLLTELVTKVLSKCSRGGLECADVSRFRG